MAPGNAMGGNGKTQAQVQNTLSGFVFVMSSGASRARVSYVVMTMAFVGRSWSEILDRSAPW